MPIIDKIPWQKMSNRMFVVCLMSVLATFTGGEILTRWLINIPHDASLSLNAVFGLGIAGVLLLNLRGLTVATALLAFFLSEYFEISILQLFLVFVFAHLSGLFFVGFGAVIETATRPKNKQI